ncbi:MAG TPA: ferritin-like fold-containing protein [Microbacteriaceae bacterium]|nr:ferritin-like fold-containing protein [Microbacteriaceae bacterium]
MVEWFWRRRRTASAPRLRSREEQPPAARIDLEAFTPAPEEFLARAAYVQLTIFEDLAHAVTIAPTTRAKAVLAAATSASLARHSSIIAELAALGVDAGEAMERHRAVVDRFQRLTQGNDWTETALTCHLAGGFLDDLFAALAEGLPAELAERVRAAYRPRPADAEFVALLSAAMSENPRLAPRLALWGRRILGDALLVARDALNLGRGDVREEQRVEPAFSELIAQHTRRMDALGLSA